MGPGALVDLGFFGGVCRGDTDGEKEIGDWLPVSSCRLPSLLSPRED